MALDELQKGTGHHLFCAAGETVRHLILSQKLGESQVARWKRFRLDDVPMKPHPFISIYGGCSIAGLELG
jgi:hypothetical protein